MALTKSEIADAIAQKTNTTKKVAEDTFTIPGIGKLVLMDRTARVGRNPATGAEIQIPARKVVKFRVAKAATDAICGTN
jgi:DNA-binding protein HU-beta